MLTRCLWSVLVLTLPRRNFRIPCYLCREETSLAGVLYTLSVLAFLVGAVLLMAGSAVTEIMGFISFLGMAVLLGSGALVGAIERLRIQQAGELAPGAKV